MKRFFSSLVLFLTVLSLSSQSQTLTVEIPRNDYSSLEIQTEDETYTLSSKEEQLNQAGDRYKLEYGKGLKKDEKGFRERQKQYLTNAANDTLAILVKKVNKVFIDTTELQIQKVENGWKYGTENGKEYADVELFWNKNTWKYQIDFKQEDQTAKVLEKILLSSLVKMAINESKVESDDSDDIFWSTLYLLCLTSEH